MPTIYLADGITGTSVSIARQALEQQWHDVAAQFAPGPFPVFCDRLEIVERFDMLLAGTAVQKASIQGEDLQLLAIASRHRDGDDQFGRTWLMKELAAKALRDGHVPVMVERTEVLFGQRDWPKTGRDLADFIVAAVRNTLTRFRSELHLPDALCPLCETLRRVLAVPPGQPLPAQLPNEVREAEGDADGVLAVALRHDLLTMLEAARGKRPAGDAATPRLVLLVDDVHKMGKDAVQTLRALCGPLGLRAARRDVRVALVYSTEGVPGQTETIKALTDWFGESSWIQQVELDGFRSPYEDREAYEYFLLNWAENGVRMPLMVNPRDPARAEGMFKSMKRQLEGVPSRLRVTGVQIVEMFMQDIPASDGRPVLTAADDDAALLRAQNAIRGVN